MGKTLISAYHPCFGLSQAAAEAKCHSDGFKALHASQAPLLGCKLWATHLPQHLCLGCVVECYHFCGRTNPNKMDEVVPTDKEY